MKDLILMILVLISALACGGSLVLRRWEAAIFFGLATFVVLLILKLYEKSTFYCFFCGRRFRKSKIGIDPDCCAGFSRWICPRCGRGHILSTPDEVKKHSI